jgi:hypothetical protein
MLRFTPKSATHVTSYGSRSRGLNSLLEWPFANTPELLWSAPELLATTPESRRSTPGATGVFRNRSGVRWGSSGVRRNRAGVPRNHSGVLTRRPGAPRHNFGVPGNDSGGPLNSSGIASITSSVAFTLIELRENIFHCYLLSSTFTTRFRQRAGLNHGLRDTRIRNNLEGRIFNVRNPKEKKHGPFRLFTKDRRRSADLVQ